MPCQGSERHFVWNSSGTELKGLLMLYVVQLSSEKFSTVCLLQRGWLRVLADVELGDVGTVQKE